MKEKILDFLKVFVFIFLCFSTTFLLRSEVYYFYTHVPSKEYFYYGTAAFDCLLALALLFIFGRFLDKKSLADYGFGGCTVGGALKEIAQGMGIAAAMVSIVMLILFLTGNYRVTAAAWQNDLLLFLPFWLIAAMREEVIFRGYALQTLAKSFGPVGAMVMSAAIFGFLHLLNFDDQVSWQAQLYSCGCLAIDAGLVFAVAYYLKRRLWLPFGMHFTWNIFEGPVYGTFVSSITLGKPLLTGTLKGPLLLTGGVFGPEASLIEVAVCLLLVALMWRGINFQALKAEIAEENQ